MVTIPLDGSVETRFLLAAAILAIGWVGGYLLGRFNRQLLLGLGVDDAVEGTSLERTARGFGTDTVTLLARGSAWLIYLAALVYSFDVAGLVRTSVLLSRGADLLPSYLLALLVVMGGLLLGDKVQVTVDERLKGVKFPEVSLVSRILRYTVIFVAILFALAQIGVAVEVLFILLGAYLLGFIVLLAIGLHQLLIAGGAGLYLVLIQPYGIGDRVAIGEREGVVQEVDLFVTTVEEDGRRYLVPNHHVFREGASLVDD
ncbi:MAG: mechanosensitive ion channel domain-containing protein [Halodesulfurarchaeum sp.]